MKNRSLISIIKWIWIFVVILASSYFLTSRWEQIREYFHTVPFLNIFFASVFLIFGKLTLVFVSRYSLEREGKNLSFIDTFCIVSFTHLAKYIPGGIFHFVGRYGAYSRWNFTVKKSTRALISENIWLLSGALLTGSLVGIFSLQGKSLLKSICVQVPTLLLALAILVVWAMIHLGHNKFFPPDNVIPLIKIFGAQLIPWLFLGISFAFILPNLSFETISFDISVYSFGWLIGYLVVFAPGGIGIRETALAWLLSGIVDAEKAIIYSAIHRFLFIVVELLLGLVAGLISLSKQRLWIYRETK